MGADLLIADPLLTRLAPERDPLTVPFWSGGEVGELRITGCTSCGCLTHPPVSHCPDCLSRTMRPTVVSGRGVVLTYTVNHQPWVEGQAPYVLAIVGLEEAADVRITTVLAAISLDEVRVGLPVEVRFVHRDDVYYPVFVPRTEGLA